jgi:branched-subunit amino acid aminotransferase/4-amino-4-deoxychorismate lyase
VTRVYLNGAIVEEADAALPVRDRGFLFGDGLFETMRIADARVHLRERHLARMSRGADLLGFDLPPLAELRSALDRTIAANGASACVARLTVTRGVGGAPGAEPEEPPTVLITLRPLLQSRESIRLISLATPQPPLLGTERIKSTSYLGYVLAAREAVARGADEGVMVDAEGWVTEGSVSNIFVVRAGQVLTPPLSLGVLAGIARGRVIELARELSLEVREELFGIDDLRASQGCFITNAARGVVAVGSIDDVALGEPDEITLLLRAAYLSGMPSETL